MIKNPFVYVRPWNTDQFNDLTRRIWPDANSITHISEHPAIDQTGMVSIFYEHYRDTKAEHTSLYLADTDITDVIVRCRLLRTLPYVTAHRLIVSMEFAIETVMARSTPDAVLSLMVDSYVMHLLEIACKRHDIPFIGLVPNFLKDSFRITAHGEPVVSRSVTELEVSTQLDALKSTTYKPDFLVQSDTALTKNAHRLWVRNLPKPFWFKLKRYMKRDPLNYHYWASERISKAYWSLRLQKYSGTIQITRDKFAGDLGTRSVIYMPLQMSPEATIDYWSKELSWIDYENRVISILKEHAQTRTFLVKEHPNLLGFRSPGFYKRLMAEPNCIMVAPQVPSNAVVDASDGTIVCTGSAGFETALRGKPVYTDSAPYYMPPAQTYAIAALKDDIPPANDNVQTKRDLVKHLLERVLPGRFLNNGTWNAANSQHQEWNAKMAQSIKMQMYHTRKDG